MCGIAGVFGGGELADAAAVARRLGQAISHRGPDGAGCLSIPLNGDAPTCRVDSLGEEVVPASLGGVLVHRRLAVLDLVTGHQPMPSAARDVWIAYNGEIYNFRELRAELEAHVAFRTSSDTEVILEVYRRWGVAGLARLNGMFAFALYDVMRREVILARDPIGIKPLYWGRSGSRVWFASELRAPIAAGLLDARISRSALLQYLFYRFVPAPATLLESAHKVMPGTTMRFALNGDLRAEEEFAPRPAKTSRRPDASGDLGAALAEAVTRQLVSDVPVGAFLSGGIDSSLLVELVRRQVSGVETFAVGFADADGGESELVGARRAASALGTVHRECLLERDPSFDDLPSAIAQVEEPLAHAGMHLQCDLAALARQSVKVVLSGQGADEPLGGYPRHHAARLAPIAHTLLASIARSDAAHRLGESRESLARLRSLIAAEPGIARAAALFSPLGISEANAILRQPHTAPHAIVLGGIAPWWDRAEALDPVARLLYVDARTSLTDDLLLVADKTAMAHSLEVRVPFLDLEYLALVESIDGSQRVPVFGERKPLQRRIASRVLPTGLQRSLARDGAWWRAKHGFDVPVPEWLRSSARERIEGFLAGSEACLPEYLDAANLRSRLRRYLAGSGRAYRVIFSLLVLEMWMRMTLRAATPYEVSSALRRGTVDRDHVSPQ